jgi:hypothetical protein
MIAGATLNSLAERILSEKPQKHDYVAHTSKLLMNDRGAIEFEFADAKREYMPTQLAVRQIGARLQIPAAYVDRMAQEAPELLARNVNHWFEKKPEKRMIRTLENGSNHLRAFLSESYRPLDNADLMEAILPKVQASGLKIQSCQLTEQRIYLQAVTPRLESVIQRRKQEGPNEHRIGAVNDVVQAGLVISNSEVGCGAFRVEPMIYRLVCRNGLITDTAMWKAHVGRTFGGEEQNGEIQKFYSDKTMALADKAFWAKVSDTIDAALDAAQFEKAVQKLNDATGVDLGKPTGIVEKVTNKFRLTKPEGESVLEHLTRGGDLSLFGLVNAVTRTAEDQKSYDRAIEFERMGGEILELPQHTFMAN